MKILDFYLLITIVNIILDILIVSMQLLGYDFSFMLQDIDPKELLDDDKTQSDFIRLFSRFVPLIHLYSLVLSFVMITQAIKNTRQK